MIRKARQSANLNNVVVDTNEDESVEIHSEIDNIEVDDRETTEDHKSDAA